MITRSFLFAILGTALLLSPFNLAAQEPSAEVAESIDLLIQQGVELYDNGQYEEALDSYHKALALDSENISALYEICLTHLALKNYDKCLEIAESGSKQESRLQGQFYTVLGTCYDNMGEPKKAVKAYKKGIALSPRSC